MKILLIVSTLLLASTTFAQDMLVIRKSMNQKNVLHYKANVTNCKLAQAPVSAYWTMGESDGHVEELTNQEKQYFAPKVSYNNGTEADFSIGAIEKMGSKLPDKVVRIRLENCKPKAFLEMKGEEIQVTDIFVSVNMLMSVKYMTITGIAPNGAKVSHTIK